MNIKSIAATAAAAAMMAVASPSFASVVTIDFEGINDQGFIHNFYNGGTDIPASSGATPASGPNYHIAFGDALVPGLYDSAPSGSMIMFPFGEGAIDATMSGTDGFSFSNALSFSYIASSDFSIVVRDAASAVIATFDLLAADSWTTRTFSFEGYAKSFDFSQGAAALAGFDDITVNEVPIPAAGWLLASGLAALGGRMRRKRIA